MERNNFFDFATGELTQDAFICWLINWINHKEKDRSLYNTSKALLDSFFEKASKKKPEEYIEVVIKQQFENIDILFIVNNKYVIIIEDKVDTSNHSGQLSRYKQVVLQNKAIKGIPDNDHLEEDLLCIYFKTGNQSRFDEVNKRQYFEYTRKDFLNVLKACSTLESNNILHDYLSYLQTIEDKTNSFLDNKVSDWSWWAWEGLMMYLYDDITKTEKSNWVNWHYVNNPRGGFWGLYWNWIVLENNPEIQIYCQFELDMKNPERRWLCYKVYVKDKDRRAEIRNRLYRLTKDLSPDSSPKNKPNFRSGEYMTFWIYEKNVFEDNNNKLNTRMIKKIIIEAQTQLEEVAAAYEKKRNIN